MYFFPPFNPFLSDDFGSYFNFVYGTRRHKSKQIPKAFEMIEFVFAAIASRKKCCKLIEKKKRYEL